MIKERKDCNKKTYSIANDPYVCVYSSLSHYENENTYNRGDLWKSSSTSLFSASTELPSYLYGSDELTDFAR